MFKKRLLLLFGFLGLCLLGLTAVPAQPLFAADSTWQAKYFNTKNLTGDPVVTRQEANIDHDWGHGAPVSGVNQDNFSVRWKRTVNVTAGSYRFTATMDDGMRVWVDNTLIIDSWNDSQQHTVTADVYLNGGDRVIKVEYYDAGGQAVAKLSWAPIGGSAPVPISNWKGEYFNNMALSGSPVLVRDDASVDFNWGGGSPQWGTVSSDQFSVRWTRNLALDGGRYRFYVTADDGARLWVNGRLLVDQWHDGGQTTYTGEIDLPGGAIPVQLEYFENSGGSIVKLEWLKVGGGSSGQWSGQYFNNTNLSGTPALTRSDANINFTWGNGSPANGINADNFSVRWTGSLNLAAGRYRFSVTSDDGVRVWVNNQQVINNWSDHQPQNVTGEITLPGGSVPVVVEYYEHVGGAKIQFSWSVVSSTTPAPAPAPVSGTGTVISSLLNVRTGPGVQYNVLHVLSYGQTVNLTGYRSADANWVQIHWNNSTAWVSGKPYYLQANVTVANLPVWQGTPPATGGPSPTPTTGPTATIGRVYYLNMRTGPGMNYTIIKAMPAGTVVQLLGRNASSSWAKVRLTDGSVGWMSGSYLLGSTPISALPLTN